MHKTTSQELSAKINLLRQNNAKAFQTNYFTFVDDIDIWLAENDNALAFLIKEKDFYKLFYAFVSIDDFEKLLNALPDFEIYLEIVSRQNPETELERVLKKFFEYKTTYQKLYKKLEPAEPLVNTACLCDLGLIFDKLYTTFNVYFEHLMSKDDLQKLIDDNKVITIYEGSELKSFLIYKTQGTKAYLNHIANYGSKENLIDLWKQFYRHLNNDGIKYLDLWYDMQNKKAENMYGIEKFRPVGMFNFCYKKIRLSTKT